jgi:hypothetical protein
MTTARGIECYVESGAKRVFAGALEWPGWCRAGRDATSALEALVAYAPRYAKAVRGARPAFRSPGGPQGLSVVERLKGDATTDFGAPSIAPGADARPLDVRELARLRGLLTSCWNALDDAAAEARGLKLRTGPRGGGRSLPSILGHVAGAEAGYLRRLAATPPAFDERAAHRATTRIREVVLETLERAVAEGLPERGPRGGKIWLPRYFIRRAAWHALDHAWEIQDRSGAE